MENQEEFHVYLKAAVAALNEEDERHLSEAEMVAYYQRRMSEAERETAQDHLAHCGLCLQLFRDTRDFFDPRREGESEIDDLHVRREWKALLAKLPQEEQTTEVEESAAAAAPGRRGFFRVSRSTMALAAGLALTLGLNGVLAWQLLQERTQKQEAEQELSRLRDGILGEQKKFKNELDEAEQALQNMPSLLRLLPGNRRSQEKPKEIRLPIPANTRSFQLKLIIPNPNPRSEYTIELVDSQGTTIEKPGLKVVEDEDNGYTLNAILPRLKNGRYRLRLYERTGKSEKPPVECQLLVTSKPST